METSWYPEELGDRANLNDVKYRSNCGALPVGLPPETEIYAFDLVMDPNQARTLMAEGAVVAAAEHRRRRLPPLAEVDQPPLAVELDMAPPVGGGDAFDGVGGGGGGAAPGGAAMGAAAGGGGKRERRFCRRSPVRRPDWPPWLLRFTRSS